MPRPFRQHYTRDIPAEWWKLFESEALDALVRQALLDSPRLAQLNARLVQARENLGARQAATNADALMRWFLAQSRELGARKSRADKTVTRVLASRRAMRLLQTRFDAARRQATRRDDKLQLAA